MSASLPPPPRGSTAHTPDLDWSQVRETVLMLELAAMQIEAAMRDSHGSVDVLTRSFTTMADSMQGISSALASLPASVADVPGAQRLRDISGQVSGMIHEAVIAFQFYDKLVQRLTHVGLSLGDLSDLVGDGARLFNPGEWVALQNRIRAKYTTHEETAMFDAVIGGMPVREALERYRKDVAKPAADDIELF